MTPETSALLSNHPEINQVEELIRNLFTQEVKIGGLVRISKMCKNRTIDFFKKTIKLKHFMSSSWITIKVQKT